jgi:hypothetical protein
MSFKNFEGQTARWVQRLQGYNFFPKVAKAGKTNMLMLSQDGSAKNIRIVTRPSYGQT